MIISPSRIKASISFGGSHSAILRYVEETVLNPHILKRIHGYEKDCAHCLLWVTVFGTPSGARTLDTLIKSQVLYQLS